MMDPSDKSEVVATYKTVWKDCPNDNFLYNHYGNPTQTIEFYTSTFPKPTRRNKHPVLDRTHMAMRLVPTKCY